MPETRAATLRSLAKINVDLRVLHKRPDNFHELRTVFQTISLEDSIGITFEPSRRTCIEIEGNLAIPNNLILRAAEAVLAAARIRGTVRFSLDKRIPMGAGLGGGSSNAAAVLLALPVLAGAHIPLAKLVELGTALGSDVPFFLYGGTALGVGRGTELYPLADLPSLRGLLVTPDVHVSTGEAYAGLNRGALTTDGPGNDTETFRSLVWTLAEPVGAEDWRKLCANDFERVVFKRHPALRSIKRELDKLGASPAMMTGSGSALFGLFESPDLLDVAFKAFSTRPGGSRLYRISLVTRRRYRSLWRRQLAGHVSSETLWPPRSRYLKL